MTTTTPVNNVTTYTDHQTPSENRFGVWDYVIFAVLLATSSAIGLYYGCTGKKQSSTSEFLMAGRSMGVFPVALSLLASFMSAITLLGTPAEIAVFGTQFWIIGIAYCFVIPASAYIFIPIFYKLNVTSVFEYLEKRFSRGVRTYTCIVYIIQTELYLALVLYAPCLALSVVTGLNKWIAVCSVGIVCTFYTTIGGMKAVMWTDVVQIILMFLGLIGILIKGSTDHKGFGNILEINYENDRVHLFDFNPNPMVRHTFWSLVIGGTFTWLAIYGVNQAQVQRALCTPTCRQGQIALWVNLPGLIGLLSICALCGLVVFAEYHECDPLKIGRVTEKDQLLPLYVMDRMNYPGFPGFFTACIFSGGLSTISSGLNSLAAVFLQDLLLVYFCKNMADSRAALASKILSVVFGFVMILLTLVAAQLGGVLQAAFGIFGIIGGPILGLFILGIFYPWANWKGAYFGITCGLIISLWLGVAAQVHKPTVLGKIPPPMKISGCPAAYLPKTSDFTTDANLLNFTFTQSPTVTQNSVLLSFYQMSYMWYSAFAVLITSVSGLLVSLITGPNKISDVDSDLLNPLVLRISKMFSKTCLKKTDLPINLQHTPNKDGNCANGYDNPSLRDESTLGKLSTLPYEITKL